MKAAIDARRTMRVADERILHCLATGIVLENIIAFEKRILEVDGELQDTKGDDGMTNPFFGVEDEVSVTDLHTLKASLPRHGTIAVHTVAGVPRTRRPREIAARNAEQ